MALAAAIHGVIRRIRQVRSPAAFAALAGTSPIPASSGQMQRHRLNRGGIRQLNRALHLIALGQARTYLPARAYLGRRRAEGKTWREAIWCLTRRVADVVHRTMSAISSRAKAVQ
jgi:transposase